MDTNLSQGDTKWRWTLNCTSDAIFNVSKLMELVQIAIRDNLDVHQAVLRVVTSRQGIVTAASAGPPQLSGSAS